MGGRIGRVGNGVYVLVCVSELDLRGYGIRVSVNIDLSGAAMVNISQCT
jgi:hypothetical protein